MNSLLTSKQLHLNSQNVGAAPIIETNKVRYCSVNCRPREVSLTVKGVYQIAPGVNVF